MSDSPARLTVLELGVRRQALEQRLEELKQDLDHRGGNLSQVERTSPALLAELEAGLVEVNFIMSQSAKMGIDYPARLERAPAFYMKHIDRVRELLRARSAASVRPRRTSRPEVQTEEGEDSAGYESPEEDLQDPIPGTSHSGEENPLPEPRRETQQVPALSLPGPTPPGNLKRQSEAERLKMDAMFRDFLAREHPDLLSLRRGGNPSSSGTQSSQSAPRSNQPDTSVYPQGLPQGGSFDGRVVSGALQGQSNSGLSPWQSFPLGSNQGGGTTEGAVAGSNYQPQASGMSPWSTAIQAMSPDELRMTLQNVMAERLGPRPSSEKAWKPRDLKRFAGDIGQYPSWRQKLNYCLEQHRFTSEIQKAMFIVEQTSGTPEAQILYLTKPYTQDSARLMLERLDLLYGTEAQADRDVVRQLYELPVGAELKPKILTNLVTTLCNVEGPLSRCDPTALWDPRSERYCYITGLIPVRDRDDFTQWCKLDHVEPTVQNLRRFLTEKLMVRLREAQAGGTVKGTAPPKQPSATPSAPRAEERPKAGSKGAKPKPLFHTPRERRDLEKAYSAQWAEASFDWDPYSYDQDVEDLERVYQARSEDPACIHCRASHELDRCEAFSKLGLQARKEAILRANLCLSCLRKGHWVFTCPTKKACGKGGCKKIHHPLIHPQDSQPSSKPKDPKGSKGSKEKAKKPDKQKN